MAAAHPGRPIVAELTDAHAADAACIEVCDLADGQGEHVRGHLAHGRADGLGLR